MEESIISYYSRHFHNLGFMYESVKLYDDAIREYQRAIEIDPYLADSLKALGLVYGQKLEPRDYQKSIDYLGKFINLIEKSDPQQADSARYTINKIMEEQAAKVKEEQDRIASEEAKLKEATPAGTLKSNEASTEGKK
jgi:tetratricopeptide (TPR) repeat protein